MDEIDGIRSHVVILLQGGHAFDTFDEIVGAFSPDRRGVVPTGTEHSAWQVLRHIVIAQRDILDFCRNSGGTYVEMKWPDDYWPKEAAPESEMAWEKQIAKFHTDREELEELIADPASDLFAAFPWGDGQTLLREALMTAEHTAYHLGQLVVIRRLL